MKRTNLRVKLISSSWEKIVGLIGKNKPEPFYFTTRWGIHTFFMKFPIDVIILDNNYIITQMFQNLRPNRIYMWNPKYEKVVELPAGTIKRLGLKKGSQVNLQAK